MSDSSYDFREALRKEASQTTPNQEAEQMFFSQAVTFIENAAEPLMKDPFRIGFEIVYRNENLTRLVGIFIFKVEGTLLFAPVFYLNGRIKGNCLLYLTDKKLFTLLDPDWCTWIIQRYKPHAGEAIDRGQRQLQTQSTSDFNKLLNPPRTYKTAAHEAWKEMSEAAEAFFDTEKTASSEVVDGEMLQSVMEDLGYEGLKLMKETIEHNPKFAADLSSRFKVEQYLPLTALEKKASDKFSNAAVLLHTQPQFNENVKTASGEHALNWAKLGYMIEDRRPLEKCASVVVTEEADKQCMELVQGPGIYDATFSDGKDYRVLVAPIVSSYKHNPGSEVRDLDHANRNDHYGDLCSPSNWDDDKIEMRYITLEGEPLTDTTRKGVVVMMENNEVITKPAFEEVGSATPTAGDFYVLLDPERRAFVGGPFYVHSVDGDVAVIENGQYMYHSEGEDVSIPSARASCCELQLNSNSDVADPAYGVINKNMRFIKLSKVKDGNSTDVKKMKVAPLDIDQAYSRILRQGHLKLSMRMTGPDEFTFDDVSSQTRRTSKLAAALHLVREYGCHGAQAEALAQTVQKQGKLDVFIKRASVILPPTDAFDEDYDPDLAALTEAPQTQIIAAESEYPERPPMRYGDSIQLGSGAEVDALGGPIEVDNLAKRVGMRSVFEHGIIGSLVREFDAAAVVDRYLPDLEKGLDRLGRLYFLICYKPDDFGRMFGVDDVQTMESSIEGTFRSLGRLNLDILQKTSAPKTSVVDAG
jgi:hypothetical protein